MLNRYLIVDLEATGPNPSSAEILTGSFLYCDEELNIQDVYELEVRPRVWDKEAEEAVAIHGITHAQAMRFTPFPQAITDLSSWLDTLAPAHFVAHANRKIFGKFTTYDYALLNTSLFDLNFQWSLYRAAPVRYLISTHSLAKYLSLPCEHNLKAIAQHLGVEAFKHHDAKDDAIACYEILKVLLPRVSLEDFFNWEYGIKEVENESRREALPSTARKRASKNSGKLPGHSTALI